MQEFGVFIALRAQKRLLEEVQTNVVDTERCSVSRFLQLDRALVGALLTTRHALASN